MEIGGKISPNFVVPKINSLVDGQYLKEGSVAVRSLVELPNVDKKFVAGEVITAGQAVGLYGELVEVNNPNKYATAATYVDHNNADTNYDGNDLTLTDYFTSPTNTAKLILIKFSTLPTFPAYTGSTLLQTRIRFSMYLKTQSGGNSNYIPQVYANTANFTEATVTWNTKPTTGTNVATFPTPTGGSVPRWLQTAWVVITYNDTDWNDINDHGISVYNEAAVSGTFTFADEDDATYKPYIEVEWTYKIQDDKIYKVNATTVQYANSFVGISQSNVSQGDTTKIRVQGKDTNQTGLTIGTTYKLSDTDGAITSGATTNTFKIGRALKETELEINYMLDQAT